MKNQILEKRICQLISQTFAVPLEKVLEEAKQIGIDEVIKHFESENTPKFN